MQVGRTVAGLLALASLAPAGAVAVPDVVVGIQPIHSLVAGVMQGIGEPHLLVRPGASPHAYQLRPSEARLLSSAGVVFWIGEGVETFLKRPLASLAGRARVVTLADAEGLLVLGAREGGVFGEERPGSSAGHEHADQHIWLDPRNAARLVDRIASVLAEMDAPNAAHYEANRRSVGRRLDALEASIDSRLEPVRTQPYVVVHDAYRYFEQRFGLRSIGALGVLPHRLPGAARMRALRDQVRALGVRCVFREPQFESALARTLVEGTGASLSVLDALGGGFNPGPEAYFEMMAANARSLEACLRP